MAEGVATYEHDYWSKRNRSHQTINTWKGYLRTMLKVPQKGPLNAEFLLQAIVAKPKPNMNGSAIGARMDDFYQSKGSGTSMSCLLRI